MAIGAGISLRGIHFEEFNLPVKLASDIKKEDEGKAVTLDTSAANTVKLAGDGDVIFGRLEVVEDRKVEGILVGTVAVRFSNRLPIKSGETFAVGDTAVGAGSGEVKPRTVSDGEGGTVKEADWSQNVVVEVDSTNGFVVVLKA